MYGKIETYGQKGFISRLLGVFARLNRKGYILLNCSKGLSKDLKKRGMLI